MSKLFSINCRQFFSQFCHICPRSLLFLDFVAIFEFLKKIADESTNHTFFFNKLNMQKLNRNILKVSLISIWLVILHGKIDLWSLKKWKISYTSYKPSLCTIPYCFKKCSNDCILFKYWQTHRHFASRHSKDKVEMNTKSDCGTLLGLKILQLRGNRKIPIESKVRFVYFFLENVHLSDFDIPAAVII